jgi:hypothetical protein
MSRDPAVRLMERIAAIGRRFHRWFERMLWSLPGYREIPQLTLSLRSAEDTIKRLRCERDSARQDHASASNAVHIAQAALNLANAEIAERDRHIAELEALATERLDELRVNRVRILNLEEATEAVAKPSEHPVATAVTRAIRLTDDVVEAAKELYDNRLGWSDGRNPYAPPLFWDALGRALGRPESGMCEPSGPSRFKIGDRVRITPPPGEWKVAPETRTVEAVHFTESKVLYDLSGPDGTITGIDSCDVEPASEQPATLPDGGEDAPMSIGDIRTILSAAPLAPDEVRVGDEVFRAPAPDAPKPKRKPATKKAKRKPAAATAKKVAAKTAKRRR